MNSANDDRLRSFVLAVSAFGVLVAGGWWWVDSAPESSTTTASVSGPDPASTGPDPASTGPDAASTLPAFGLLAPVAPGVGVMGQPLMIDNSERGGVAVVDPATGALLEGTTDHETGPNLTRFPFAANYALPQPPNTVWRRLAVIDAGATHTWSVPARSGDRFLLQYLCVGPAGLSVQIRNTRYRSTHTMTRCTGEVQDVAVVARNGLRISAMSVSWAPIEGALQLIELPPRVR